jgi:predicted enzyme related to lactoylglutathione lyase
MTLQGSWIWYELMTPDADGSKAFYDRVVGWNIQTTHGDDAAYGFINTADGGMTGGVLHLTADMQQNGARPCWLGYIGVDDVDASLTAIEAAGGKVLMPARDIEMAGRIAMVADPNGAPFYVMTPTPPPRGGESTAFSPTLPGRCAWNELMGADQQAALDFYTGLFGWALPEPMDMGAMGTYQFVAHDNVTTGAIMRKPPQAPVSAWTHYFRVADIKAAKAAAEEAGGQIMTGPMEVPNGDWIIQGMDPQGAFFALVGANQS